MVGELDLAIADQSARIEFLGDHAMICFADFRSARTIVGQPMPSLRPIGKLLAFGEIGLQAKVGKRKSIELFPKPGRLIRWLSPAIREMFGDANA